MKEKVKKKIEKIAENPETGVPKRYNLKGARGVHVNPFVITYVIIRDAIVFITINHHDLVYGETSAIYSQLMERYSDLWSETPGEQRKIRPTSCLAVIWPRRREKAGHPGPRGAGPPPGREIGRRNTSRRKGGRAGLVGKNSRRGGCSREWTG